MCAKLNAFKMKLHYLNILISNLRLFKNNNNKIQFDLLCHCTFFHQVSSKSKILTVCDQKAQIILILLNKTCMISTLGCVYGSAQTQRMAATKL